MGTQAELVLVNDRAKISTLIEFVETFGEMHDLPMKLVFHLGLCLDELVTNVISYGFEDEDRHEIVVRLDLEGRQLTAQVIDGGLAFDPFAEAAEADTESDVDDRAIGGLGVHFVKTFMDTYDYRRDGERNIVTLGKTLPAPR